MRSDMIRYHSLINYQKKKLSFANQVNDQYNHLDIDNAGNYTHKT
jgi:hypothetical protein